MLGVEELTGRTKHYAFDWFYELDEIRQLKDQVSRGELRLRVLGFGFDLINCEPNLALLATIENQAFSETLRRRVKGNWEVKQISSLGLDDPRLANLLADGKLSPGAAFAYSEAVQFLITLEAPTVTN